MTPVFFNFFSSSNKQLWTFELHQTLKNYMNIPECTYINLRYLFFNCRWL